MTAARHARRRGVVTLLVAAPIALVMCASATEIDVDVYSEVDCAKHAEVALVVGNQLTDLGANAATSTAVFCDASQRVGRVVLSPSGSNDGEIAFQIVTRNDDQSVESCTAANNYAGCIVARRQLHFSSHKALDVRVDLRLSCLDNPCDPNSTCVRGDCVPATCPETGCPDETALLGPSGSDGGMPTQDTGVPPDASDSGKTCNPPAAGSPPVQATIVASAGGITNPSGLAQQSHLFFAENDCRYWYFAVSSATTVAQILTYYSTDLLSWTAGTPIPLGTGTEAVNNGGDFSVAYVNKAGVDVFHIVTDQPSAATGYAYEYRVTLANGAFSTPIMTQVVAMGLGVSGQACFDLVDGPSIAIDRGGHVFVATGWTFNVVDEGTHCDMNVYRSAGTETGNDSDWMTSFTQTGFVVTAHQTTDHLLFTLPDAGTVVGSFDEPETADESLAFTSVAWITDVANWDGAAQPGYGSRFGTGSIFDSTNGQHQTNDWSVCAVSDNEIHAIRHRSDGTFEATEWKGTTWAAELGGNPADVTLAAPEQGGGGVVIMSDDVPSHGMTAFALSEDAMTILYARYTPTNPAWTAWKTAAFSADAHSDLAGTGCGRAHPTLVWTAGGSAIVAEDVSSLFNP